MVNSNLAIFPISEQRAFIERVIKSSGKNCNQLADIIGISGRTVRDWRREKFKMSFLAVKKFSKLAGVSFPKNIRVQKRYSHASMAGKLGGLAIVKKFRVVGGDQEKRKIAWRRWWLTKGRLQNHPLLYKRQSIQYPKPSIYLAEFFGILMGDGGISARQVIVTLDSETDKDFAQYVSCLWEKLFGVIPHIRKIKNARAINLVVSRTDLVEFCHKLGLPIGNKILQGLDIPIWIKQNRSYSRFCLRGLIDTDGSIFTHAYRVAGKQYTYKKLDFCSLSKPLLKSAYEIFNANGMRPYVSQGKKLRLDNQNDVKRYFEVIGTSNAKHLRRYKN